MGSFLVAAVDSCLKCHLFHRKYQQQVEAESKEQEKQRWVSISLSHQLTRLHLTSMGF